MHEGTCERLRLIGRIRRVKQSIQNIILFSVSGVDPSQQLRISPFACSFPLSPLCSRTGGKIGKEKTKNLMDKDRWLSRWRKEQGGKKDWITQRDLLTTFHKQRNAQTIWARSLWKDYLPVLLLSKDIKKYGISFGSAVLAVPPLSLLCTPSPLTGEQNKK